MVSKRSQLPPERQTKRSKVDYVKKLVSSVFGYNKNESFDEKTPSPQPAEAADTSITASQLHSYYRSLQQQSASLSSSFNETPVPNSDLQLATVADETFNKAESTIMKTEPPIEIFTTEPITPDALERANLLEIKRMMELEKYRKIKLAFLRKHTKHVDRKVVKIPTVKKVTHNGKTRSGVYGISLLDTVGDIEEKDDEPTVDITSKLKFSDKASMDDFDTAVKPKSFIPKKEFTPVKVDDVVPSAGFSFESKTQTDKSLDASKPATETKSTISKDNSQLKGLDLTKENDKSTFTFSEINPKKEEPPAFSFSAPKTETSKEETKPAFNFGLDKTEESKEMKPSFSFGGKTDTTKEEAKPTFSFGGLGKPEDKKEATPAFSFGGSKTEESKKAATPAFNFGAPAEASNETAKPVFSFGGATNVEQKEKETKPAFSFGGSANPEEKKESAPAFSFGGPVRSEEKKETKPAFSFGGSANSEEKKESTLAFSFGGPVRSEEKKQAAPAFSFGGLGKPEEKKEATPTFSFGGATKKEEHKAGAFDSTGKKRNTIEEVEDDGELHKQPATFNINEMPKFSFNKTPVSSSTLNKSDSSTTTALPSMKLGAGTDKHATPSLNFNFGQTDGKSATANSTSSNFTVGDIKKDNTDTEAAPAKSFSFGAKPDSSSSVANGFSFNNGSKPKLSGFALGADSNNKTLGENTTAPTSAASGFSFGSNKAEPSTGSAPATAFSFNNKPATSSTTGFNGQKGESQAPSSFSFTGASTNNSAAPAASSFSFNGGKKDSTPVPAQFQFGNKNSSTPTPTPSFNAQPSNSSTAFGGAAKPFSFETASDPPAFDKMGMKFGNTQKPNTGFTFGSGSASSNNNNNGFRGSNNNNSSNNGFNEFGNNNSSNAKNSFGGMNNNFGGNNNNSSGFGMSNSNSGFGNNSASGGFSFNNNSNNNNINQQNNVGNGFGINNNSGMPGMNNGMGNNNGFGFTPNSTPNTNFFGQTNVDPSTIFNSEPSSAPPAGPNGRKLAYPRGSRRKR